MKQSTVNKPTVKEPKVEKPAGEKPTVRNLELGSHRVGLMATILLALVSLTGCCTDPVNGERYFCLYSVSDAEEAAMGAQYAPDFIAQSGGVYPDSQLQSHLRSIVIDRMARKSHRPDLPWEFTILNTSQINAFALPGGKVFVTRGLLSRLESEAQFAHLMGHEIGHVTHRHSVRGQQRSAVWGLLLGAVSLAEQTVQNDPNDPLWASQLLGAAGGLAMLKFSRDQELQCDERGVDYALQAGFDPRESTKTFELFLSLKESSGQSESLVQALLSTHPLDSTRIEKINSYIDENYPNANSNVTVSSPTWQAQIAKVKRAQPVYDQYDRAMAMVTAAREAQNLGALDEAERLIRNCQEQLPTHATFHVGSGIVGILRDDLNGARRHLDRACSLDPNLFEARYTRGIVLRQLGENALAAADLEAAQSLFPSAAIPHYHAGLAYKSLGRVNDALASFERTIQRSPQDSELHRAAAAELSSLTGASAAE